MREREGEREREKERERGRERERERGLIAAHARDSLRSADLLPVEKNSEPRETI